MSARSGTPEAGGPAARLRALIVEDEAPLAALVRSYLEREGFEVETAGDGETAVEAARERSPDVIVLDLMLPGIDGIEACRRIRAFSDAYIVMLTARAEEVDKIVGLSTGADDYVTKPFSPGELVARIRAMLRRPRAPAPEGLRGASATSPSTRSAARCERTGSRSSSPGSSSTSWTRCRSAPGSRSRGASCSSGSGARGTGTSTSSTSTSRTCGASSATTRGARATC